MIELEKLPQMMSYYGALHGSLAVYLYAKLYAPEMLIEGGEERMLEQLKNALLDCETVSSSKIFSNFLKSHDDNI